MPETSVQTINRILREAMPTESLKAEIELMERGLEKFDAWMSAMPNDERERLIASVLADDRAWLDSQRGLLGGGDTT